MGSKFAAVEPQDESLRLDSFVSLKFEISRARAAKLIDEGNVVADGKKLPKSFKLKAGQCVQVDIPEPQPLAVLAQDIPLKVVYEDDCLLVVDKPKGMVVHPAAGNHESTLVNALLAHCKGSLSGINGIIRPGIVHRIDKDTSGLLMVAKDDAAHVSLAAQIKEHSITREYRAILYGRLREQSLTVSAPIARHRTDRKKMAVTTGGKPAVTHFEVIEELSGFTYVKAVLETGRTHQIRVHSAHIGHPVLGDAVYGPKKSPFKLNGQCLHAAKLGFIHPKTGVYMEFESELPEYFKELLIKLRK